MERKVSDIKLTFLGVTPSLQDETGFLKPQDIVSLSALLTFKGKSVKELYKDAKDRGENIEEKVKKIIRKSALRGHASISTTPAICFTYEGSKLPDLLMTGMIFSSSLVTSGRRTDTTLDDVVYPDSISSNKEAKAIYKLASENNINLFNEMLAAGIEKDEASKIMQYGIYGTGIVAYPVESLIAFKKEVEAQGSWMPTEASLIVEKVEKQMKKYGLELLYSAREIAGKNVLPFPNPMKDPGQENLAKELIRSKGLPKELTKIISFCGEATAGLEKRANQIIKKEKEFIADKKLIKKNRNELLQLRHNLCRDYAGAVELKTLSSVSLRVWSERKRHRTVPISPDSIFNSINRCKPLFKKFKAKINAGKLTAKEMREIDRFFTIPPALNNKKDLLYKYLSKVIESFEVYFKLVDTYKITPGDALYVIPRGVRLDMVMNFDLFNLIAGYYPVRTCKTVESQLRPMTRLEMDKIRLFLAKKGLPNLAKLVVTKCQIPLFCLEEKSCGRVNLSVRDYDPKFHEEMKAQLDKEMEARLKEL